MTVTYDEIGVRGKRIAVPAVKIDGHRIVVTGKFLKIARLKEEWYEDVEDPESIIRQLKKSDVRADIFTFWQRLPETEPKYNYFMERDYIAALPIKSFDHWWEKQIRSRTRGLIRKAKKKGVIVKEVDFTDEFIQGVANIFNETPIRQGKPFWHYGKDFEIVKLEFSRYLFREDLIGAFYNDNLIGFIFIAHAGKYAILGQIISMIERRDLAPNNLLIAKAVEMCDRKNIPYLVYLYWGEGTLAEFKRRNGFEKTAIPRYYIPLTLKGKIALKLHLHRGSIGILPKKVQYVLMELKKKWYTARTR